MTRSCAVCARLADDWQLEPLGRDDALVPVCARCREEEPSAPVLPHKQRCVVPPVPPRHSVFRIRRDAIRGDVAREVAVSIATTKRPDARLHGFTSRWWLFVYPDPSAPTIERRASR